MNKREEKMPAPVKKHRQSEHTQSERDSGRLSQVLLKMESNYIKGFRQRETDGRHGVLSHLTSWVNNCCQGRNNKSRILPA